MSTENKVCLYIFTHNITGLKYFGKTTRYFNEEKLLKYGGSGTYWENHKKVHGNYLSVEIYGIYNINEVKEVALKFSKDNNIVKAINESGKKIWANLKLENGLDGGNNRIKKIDEVTGLSNFQIHSKKAMETMRNDIVDGKNMLERKIIKGNNTLGNIGRSKRYKKGC